MDYLWTPWRYAYVSDRRESYRMRLLRRSRSQTTTQKL